MTTKEKILNQALILFNEKGVETITTRQIALTLGMSQGNLCYHFPKKEAIIIALYEQLVAKFDNSYQMLSSEEMKLSSDSAISSFLKIINITNQYFVDYKFLMLNFVQIMRWYPSIKRHYQTLTVQRNQQTMDLFNVFQATGLLIKEAYQGQYAHIIEQFMILNNFWLSHAEILHEGNDAQKIKHFNQLVGAFIYPYLTKKGQVAYKKAIRE